MAQIYVHPDGLNLKKAVKRMGQERGKPDTGGGTRTHKSVKLSGF